MLKCHMPLTVWVYLRKGDPTLPERPSILLLISHLWCWSYHRKKHILSVYGGNSWTLLSRWDSQWVLKVVWCFEVHTASVSVSQSIVRSSVEPLPLIRVKGKIRTRQQENNQDINTERKLVFTHRQKERRGGKVMDNWEASLLVLFVFLVPASCKGKWCTNKTAIFKEFQKFHKKSKMFAHVLKNTYNWIGVEKGISKC